MGRADSMSEFDSTKEYGNAIDAGGFADGGKYIDAVIADARKVLPQNTDFSFISWTEEGKRKTGWVYNLQQSRDAQKLFNPLQGPLRT